jgi:aryl-alcohol dehydrogenase-like predicted oxidoreductase
VTRIALGTAQFGLNYGIANILGQVDHTSVKKILERALLGKIDTLDTAISYGDSEVNLGKAGVNDFLVFTKLPEAPKSIDDINLWAFQNTNDSLKKLNLKCIEGLLLHKPLQLLSQHGEKIYNALLNLKKEGLVRKIGISIYSPNELDLILGKFRFDLIQAPLSLVDQRLVNSGWLKRIHNEGIELHTRSVFLQGLLLMSYADIPSKFKKWDVLWNEWHYWLMSTNSSAVDACLFYPLMFPEISRVIVGVDNLTQLDMVIKSANYKLPSDLPNLSSNDLQLINPSEWSKL